MRQGFYIFNNIVMGVDFPMDTAVSRRNIIDVMLGIY